MRNLPDFYTRMEHASRHRLMLVGISAFFVIFIVWAAVTHIDQHVRGNGRIIPDGKMRSIQHLEGGIIKEILVNEGDTIEPNQIMFRLSNTRANSEVQELQIALAAARLRNARLAAEVSEAKTLILPAELVDAAPAVAETEQELFNARQMELKEKLDGIQNQINQKILKLDDLNTAITNLRKEASVAQEQLEIKSRLRASGAISRSQYLEAESAVHDFTTRISRIEKEIPITKAELAETVNLQKETLQKWKADIIEEQNKGKIEINTLAERARTYADTFNRTEIVSPIKGVVNKLNVNTIGGVVSPGMVLAEIIPIEESLVVEGRISTNDRGKVWPGQKVVAKVTAYDYTVYGGVDGKLTYISPDSLIDSQNNEYYRVRVVLDKIKVGKDRPIYPGMTVDLNIMAGRISVLNSILRPFWLVKDDALREK